MLSESKKICHIVDDTRGMRLIIDNWMTNAGMICTNSENGSEARAHIERHCPDVLITDIEMPLFNGLELVCWVRQSQVAKIASLPIVVVTGLHDPELEKILLELGTRFVVRKPLSEEAVLSMVHLAMNSQETPRFPSTARDSLLTQIAAPSLIRQMAQAAMRTNFRSPTSVSENSSTP